MLGVLCRGVLGLLGLYHCVTGVVSVGFPDFSEAFYQTLYHFHPEMTAQYKLILRPWGALALFAGVVGLVAATDPRRYIGVVWAIAGLLLLRVVYRLWLADEMWAVFRIDPGRNVVNVGIILVEVAILVVWCVRAHRSGHPTG